MSKMQGWEMRITKCEKCNYQAITSTDVCLKCGGKLEVLAEEKKDDM